MKTGAIHRHYRAASGSDLISALAESLERIKREDNLTDGELGRFLGKSGADQGKAYRTGFAEMPVTSFFRGVEKFDGRFANDALALVGMKLVPLESSAATDRDALPAITGLLHEVAVALADDGKIDDRELMAMRPELESAGRAIDMLRERLRLRSVA
ncbi:hypothetical protein PQ455_01585 [Sphingomonas naphthae]|uniref:XRE family transcriptional regulator n=1 Tax=Sphingomonas naphthae TaxID=1813468 RepID=A0ABY7TL31_9SPHN|nr:hypothetical protein [Sphingomonas naphthae]WCT73952.1 hypothetical protein PQ455_01585 [Sphingomonas naphthae]